jgi:signal transduction histidine kinase
VTESDGEVVATVRDNGRGFDPAIRHPGHFGLESMRSRASEVGGRLTIASAPGRGTVVAVRVPAGEDGQSDGGRATP